MKQIWLAILPGRPVFSLVFDQHHDQGLKRLEAELDIRAYLFELHRLPLRQPEHPCHLPAGGDLHPYPTELYVRECT